MDQSKPAVADRLAVQLDLKRFAWLEVERRGGAELAATFLGFRQDLNAQERSLEATSADLQAALAVPQHLLWSGLGQRQLRPELMHQPDLDPQMHQEALLGLALGFGPRLMVEAALLTQEECI